MALIACQECGNQVSTTAIACPKCGGKISARRAAAQVKPSAANSRIISPRLILGIVVMPYLFAWFLLRKGYSTQARVVSFCWLALILSAYGNRHPNGGAVSASPEVTASTSTSTATATATTVEKKDADPGVKRAALGGLAIASLRRALRDPDSLAVEDVAADKDGVIACITYRAQNGFGGMNRAHVVFTRLGGDESNGAWRKLCAGKDLYNVTRNALTMEGFVPKSN